MTSSDGLTSANNDYVLAKSGEVYAVYLPNGGDTNINLPGGNLSSATTITNSISAPDNNDWVALIKGESDGTGGDCNNTEVATPSEDAYLQGTTAINDQELRVESGNRITYLKFTVPSTTENITNTKLELTVSSDAGSGLIEVFKGTSNNWTESNLSDANKPGEGAKIGTLNTTYSLGQSYQWTLTDITPGETVSLIIKQTGGNDVSFSSKEGTNAPRLILELECNDGGGGDGNEDCVALEQNGVAAVEAEHFVSQSKTDNREWYVLDGSGSTPTPDPDPSHHDSASGGGYLEFYLILE